MIREKQREMNVRLKPQDISGSDSDQKPKRGKPQIEYCLLQIGFFFSFSRYTKK